MKLHRPMPAPLIPRLVASIVLMNCVGLGARADNANPNDGLAVAQLSCEGLIDPLGIDQSAPRLSWVVTSAARGQKQTAYRILVASSAEGLDGDKPDLWDSGKIESGETRHIVYGGKPLVSRQACYWKVQAWDRDGTATAWSKPARWSMGLLQPGDWSGHWVSFRDTSAVHADRNALFLPPARDFRKEFAAGKPVKRATVYASALGIFDLYMNGKRVDESMFAPGWSDYGKRAYYRTYDVTASVRSGANAIGASVADGWYAGYVGYGLLVGYGPNHAGRCFYGKTPALLAQLELEYADGSRDVIATDSTWRVSGKGPVREADLIMGEAYDARLEQPRWSSAGFDVSGWEPCIAAEANGSTKAIFSDTSGDREVELGFRKPPVMQAYPGPPVRAIQELPAVRSVEQKPGVWIYDLGQNFAGIVRLKVHGPAGTRVQLRYGEMLHPDGRLMTENLRRARATDYYTLRGDAGGESWTARFTYHGFRYVELTGLSEKPAADAVTGIVVHSDTPLTSRFECSDPMANRLFQNIVWTQRANFIDIPTDCPQRDERLGWMGDAQIYVRAATYNADVNAFFTKWMCDVEEAQRSFGAYADYAPYPMSHGEPRKSFGTAWMDAGIICPWTVWKVYGDKRIIERHYDSMTRFMEFRAAVSPQNLGVSIGNPWGDWLNLNEKTPVEYVDACYYAYSASLMAEMADAIGRARDADRYRRIYADIRAAFEKRYVNADGTLKVQTQTAYVLALAQGLIPEKWVQPAADNLAAMIERNGFRMATGFLGTKPLLPVLSAHGHHDLALRLFQSRKFPSWGYEVENGATTVWERWDSYTKEHGFDGMTGSNNAAMNSFSHYSFGAVCEWMFRSLAGIDTDGPGFAHIVIRPGPPAQTAIADVAPITWVKASYDSPHGTIRTDWKQEADRFSLNITIPANATARVHVPAANPAAVSEGGQPLDKAAGIRVVGQEGDRVVLEVASGTYAFEARRPTAGK